MDNITRFSSRRERLDRAFLIDQLRLAKSYKRIAGYFRSSIFELVGEEIAHIPDVRIVCNSELDASDITISKAARETALKEKWNQVPIEIEALLHRDRYRKLYELLLQGNVQVRVMPKDKLFLHGKAGIIETDDGKTCFLGSANESKSAFTENYEIIWSDTSKEGVDWVEEEFDELWKVSYPLPDAIIEEIKRVSERVEIRFDQLNAGELPAAVFAESPIYRHGEQLQPWQRSFVTMFQEHKDIYGKARLSVLSDDGPALILCPSTLTLQWQVELNDRLGVPSAVWLSNRKMWVDPDGHLIKTQGATDIVRCPYQIAIVSTGLIYHTNSTERSALLGQRYGTVVLDEAHRARRKGGLGEKKDQPNNLLEFMLQIGRRAKNLLLGTATPIQTEVYELWDLMEILNSDAEFVLGRENVSGWVDWERALPIVKGETVPANENDAWEMLRNPLPPSKEDARIAAMRLQLGIDAQSFFCNRPFTDFDYLTQENIRQMLNADFFKANNPIVRHTVLRRRDVLEDQGLLEKIATQIHPDPHMGQSAYAGQDFDGIGLMTNHPFDLAYQAAEGFTEEFRKRTRAAGFMKSMLPQRICSSFASGKATAERMLKREMINEDDDEYLLDACKTLTRHEASCLETIIDELSRPEARDPKLSAVKYFLTEHRAEGKTWLEHGCIIFSQYYDTVLWIATELAKMLPEEAIAIYAGLGKSKLFRYNEANSVKREEIKEAVKNREIRLVVATDAACEGLNLQTLGTLINVDLPWNPSRLAQRLGRIKRIGQVRKTIDMLNLVYHDTQDEKIYQTLSRRFKDKFDIFGGLPDTIEDDWIDDVVSLEEMMDKYIHLRQQAKNAFEIRYQATIEPDQHCWELCSRVLARTDIVERLSKPW
jgi:superfamily II DNA or RNA helicase